MLFIPEADIEAIEKLVEKLEEDGADEVAILHQILKHDPYDVTALVALTDAEREGVEREEKLRLAWRLTEAVPDNAIPYLSLLQFFPPDDPLGKGLAELGFRKLLLNPESIEDQHVQLAFQVPGTTGEDDLHVLHDAADRLLAQRDAEPVDVSARLRPHRLLYEVQVKMFLSRERVDEIVAEGPSIVPLLIGVLRAWITDTLGENTEFVGVTLGLLGEIADMSVFSDLIEMPGADDVIVNEAGNWAVSRVVAKRPEEAARIMTQIAPASTASTRVAIANLMMQSPTLDPRGVIFEKLFERFDLVQEDAREAAFQFLLSAGIVLYGREGIEKGRGHLRRLANTLSREIRRDADELLNDAANSADLTPLTESEPLKFTVYDVCAGEVDWEAEAAAHGDEHDHEHGDEELTPEPIQRPSLPGRNDPCWCGSGKKYKKCHLDSDEERQRETL